MDWKIQCHKFGWLSLWSISSIWQIFYKLAKKYLTNVMLKLPGDWEGCPNKLSRKRNKSSENSVCVWITHKKLSHFIRQIFLIKNSIFYENLLIPCFRSCKGFYLIWSISKILKFEMFLWNYEMSLFPCFGNLMDLCLTRKM